MTIKSLLLGSAASLVAVSGAQAADAIIIEPEPVEYVRVCDAYGAGFFYIPGTETCLRVSGYVRFQLGFGSENNWYGFDEDTYNAQVRARVNFDARSETEFGTLRSFIRIQGTETGIDPTTDIAASFDQAFIELGGLRMGYTESAWAASPAAGLGQFGAYSDDGLGYDYQQRALLQYNYVANGFGFGISLEDDDTDDMAPDVVGTLSYTTDAFGVWAKVGYDEETSATDSDDAFGVTVGAQVNFADAHNFKLQGFYSSYDSAPTDGYTSDGGPIDGSEWSLLASYRFTASEQLNFILSGQYFWDTNFDAAGSPDGFVVEAEVNWYPVDNFEVKTAVAYSDFDGLTGDDSAVGGFIRFTRSF